MAGDERWYFSKEEINDSPSRKCAIDAERELTFRQQGAKLIQDMGQRLQVTQLVINTAIVYMHRFYMFHSFAKFHRHNIAPAALFLAAKVEEQPRKLEHVIKVAQYIICHHEHSNNLDAHTEVCAPKVAMSYTEKAQELVMNENILLQTLGFDVAIDHPHTHVVKCFQMVRTPTELAQTSYLMATNSLHMTTMCLQYKPSVVACVCIYIICKWSNFEIQRFNEGKAWFCLVDPTVTLEVLEMLTSDFLTVLDKYPNRLKKIINAPQNNLNKDKGKEGEGNNDEVKSPTKHNSSNSSLPLTIRPQSVGGGSRSHDANKSVTGLTKALAVQPSAANSKTVLSHKEYSEKREKERREREKERERQDQREKHPPLHPAPSASSSASSSYVPSITSTSTYSPLVPHLRSSEAGGRKMHADNNRQPAGHGSSNRGTALTSSAVFKDLNPKREAVSSRNERLDKAERTSENNVDSVKYVNEKLKSSVDYNRHSHSDWTQSRQLEYAKDRKLDIKMEVKPEVKFVPKDNRPLENREQKDFAPKVNENKIKTESVWVKTEKIEPKEEVKVHEPVVRVKVQKNEPKEDLKHNSCIFNNNDFSLQDFLNPSEMPPEDIFDTGIDYKSNASESSYYSAETTHHKLKSPPKSGSSAQVATAAPQPISSSTSLKGTSNSNANNKQGLETHHASAEAKNTKHSNLNPASTNIYTHGSQSLDKNLGNGLPATPNLVASGASNLPSSSSRRKEKIRSPLSLPSHPQALKAKHQTLNPEHVSLVTHIKSDNHKPLPTKESAPANSQDVPPKDSQPSVVPRGRSAGPSATLEKAGSLSQTPHSFTPIKTSSIVEAPKVDTVVNVRLSHPEACEVNAGAFTMPAPVAPNPSSTALPSPLKKHKYEHGHHKHKEKKKHKHKDKDKEEKKEKDKHKEKESKEHKKGRKHKKHKDKDKDKKKEEKKKEEMLQQQHQQQLMQQSQTPAKEDGNATGPLKITIHRTKGIYTPDVPTGTARVQSSTPVVEREIASGSSLDTPGRIKLTIPKYRLQGNSGSQGSPPKELPTNPPKEMSTPKVKLKITKDHLKLDRGERDSRKRERAKSPSDSLQPSKLSRSSSSYNAPQVLDSTRWSSQRH